LVHVAREDLADGIIDGCGCQPKSAAYWARQVDLKRQLQRESLFASVMPQNWWRR
jgi:hypothetical protein